MARSWGWGGKPRRARTSTGGKGSNQRQQVVTGVAVNHKAGSEEKNRARIASRMVGKAGGRCVPQTVMYRAAL